MPDDVRWKQRFQNYQRALRTVVEAVNLTRQRRLTTLEQQGLIQGFEYTHELAWNILKDYLEDQGFINIIGSKNATRTAFANGLIKDGEAWMDMIKARNLTSHTYNLELAQQMIDDILMRFYPAFVELEQTFEAIEK